MPFQQRDIVKVKRTLRDGTEKTHPFLIISNERSNSHEGNRSYIGVMITHSLNKDKFTFEIKKDMVDGTVDSNCQIRLHMIASFNEAEISRDITHYMGKMKEGYFAALLDQIKEFILTQD